MIAASWTGRRSRAGTHRFFLPSGSIGLVIMPAVRLAKVFRLSAARQKGSEFLTKIKLSN